MIRIKKGFTLDKKTDGEVLEQQYKLPYAYLQNFNDLDDPAKRRAVWDIIRTPVSAIPTTNQCPKLPSSLLGSL